MFKNTKSLEKLTRNEIKALKNMDNDNIIKFKEIMRSTNNTYYVYEYCNGGNLFELLTSRKYLSERKSIIYFK
jgi:serine/threonine protein kinase